MSKTMVNMKAYYLLLWTPSIAGDKSPKREIRNAHASAMQICYCHVTADATPQTFA